ncbi:MAG: hypothetical protein DIJKHBIC_01159 [Thermoanaerobaculia bacterium]|nr:hypothetical protein [Thermoanaerobaculia bacterium]
MDKRLFEDLLDCVREMKSVESGEALPSRVWVVPEVNASAIREELALTQVDFARLMGVNVWTLRNWEQGRRRPTGSACILLRTIELHPEAVRAAVDSLEPQLLDGVTSEAMGHPGRPAPRKRGRPKRPGAEAGVHP